MLSDLGAKQVEKNIPSRFRKKVSGQEARPLATGLDQPPYRLFWNWWQLGPPCADFW